MKRGLEPELMHISIFNEEGDQEIEDSDPLNLGKSYRIRMWMDGIKPNSFWQNRVIKFTAYTSDQGVHFDKPQSELRITTANVRGQLPLEYAEFVFKVGGILPERGILLIDLDISVGWKTIVRHILTRMVVA